MTNQAITPAPPKEPPPYAKLKALIASDDVQGRFSTLLGRRAPGYLASVLTIVSDPKLIDCEPTSVLNVAAKAAILDLVLDPNLGFAWLVPYKDKDGHKIATFQLGYKGYIQLGLRSGQYQALNATEIYEGEEIKIDRLSGRIVLNGKRTSDVVTGYVGYFKLLNGFEKYAYMSKDQVIAHAKKYSKSWGYKDSPWTTEFDKMAKKTVIRQLLSKYGILSIQMMGAFEQDAEEEPIDLGKKFEVQNVIEGQFTEAPEGTQVPNFDDLKDDEKDAISFLPFDEQLVALKLAENVHAARNILAKRSPTCPLDEIGFGRAYRGWRDRGETVDNATALANEGKLP